MLSDRIVWLHRPESLWPAVEKEIIHTDVVLDIGCGIVPMNFFRPSLHIMVEPYKEYRDILVHRHAKDKSILILNSLADEVLEVFSDNSVDSVFLLDVIEHLDKDVGFRVLKHLERVARQQVVIFTPLGLMPQHAESGDSDGWGLGGVEYQEHLSGWLPEDFGPDWHFYICETFHENDFRGEKLQEPYGAMFAIKNIECKHDFVPSKIVNLRRPLPSEVMLDKVQAALNSTQYELKNVQASLLDAQRVLNNPIIRVQRKIWSFLKFWK